MKGKMNVTDVQAMVGELGSTIIGMRCANIYDIDAKTYIFKFSLPEREKVMLLVESGVRFHTTKYARDRSNLPSSFSMKLRKHLRTRRIEAIQQLGQDRVVDFKFGLGEIACHVILELYASGNIILTDYRYQILTVLRTHTYDDTARVAVRELYPIADATNMSEATAADTGVDSGATRQCNDVSSDETRLELSSQEITRRARELGAWLHRRVLELDERAAAHAAAANAGTGGKKGGTQSKVKLTLKQALATRGSGYSQLGPVLAEHAILCADTGLKPTQRLRVSAAGGGETDDEQSVGLSHSQLEALVRELHAAGAEIAKLVERSTGAAPASGYIVLAGTAASASAAAEPAAHDDVGVAAPEGDSSKSKPGDAISEDQIYDEFTPMLLAQHRGRSHLSFASFGEAVDQFYSKAEVQRDMLAVAAARTAAAQKQEKIRKDQQHRLDALEQSQEQALLHAQLLQDHADDIERALIVIRSAIATGMDWTQLDALVRSEQQRGDPIALLIDELKLHSNRVVMRLAVSNPCESDDEETDSEGEEKEHEDDVRLELVEVDISLSAHANASRLFNMKKASALKALKTIDATERAVTASKLQSENVLQAKQVKRAIREARKVFWFEKFFWFITSENYLVLSGRDAQQNEQLVKRYLRKGDAYIHADIHGASTCVLRNPHPDRPLSQLSLEQAGQMAVCRSAAWSAKMVTSAWWVHPEQVSKTAPTGEYLSTGSFMIRGRKNFLPPTKLEMGFTVLFEVDEQCVGNHLGERRVRGLDDDDKTPVQKRSSHDNDAAPQAVKQEGGEELQRYASEPSEREQGGPQEDSRQRSQNLAADDSTGAVEDHKYAVRHDEDDEGDAADDACGGDQEFENDGHASDYARGSKVRMSARERRQLKKFGDIPEPVAKSTPAPRVKNTSQQQPKLKALPRGKRGKLKKQKQKYADQDEEERRVRMIALGVLKSDDVAGSDAEAHEDAKSAAPESAEAVSVKSDSQMTAAEAHSAAAEAAAAAEEQLVRQRRREWEEQNETKEVDKILKEEGVTLVPAGVQVDQLDRLTGKPIGNDILRFCLPMCAPYNALLGYKYRVKITPGSQKKGKASKQARDALVREATASTASRAPCSENAAREKELIGGMTDAEMVAVMMGDVRLASASARQVQASQKKSKQASGKKKKKAKAKAKTLELG